MVWYLMLLHHSQTRGKRRGWAWESGILCFYIILKLYDERERRSQESGILCFYIILKRSVACTSVPAKSGILCFYIILKHKIIFYPRDLGLVSYAFTSFSNGRLFRWVRMAVWYLMLLHHSQTETRLGKRFLYVWYLMLLHHSQTRICCMTEKARVWYLMLLHHSQTELGAKNTANESGILCFYIILKLPQYSQMMSPCLVSYAFTSFSNVRAREADRWWVWYLMLLHHSQTSK